MKSVSSILVLPLLLAGCSGDDGSAPTSPPAPAAGASAPAAAAAEAPERRAIDPATTGTVRGVVRFSGDVPPPRVLEDVPKQPGCHEGHDEPPIKETLLVRDGLLQNAFVTIAEGLDGWQLPPPSSEPAVLSQHGCIYRPHVLGVQAGQVLHIHNGDPTNHNVNARARRNASFNQTQGPGGRDLEVVFEEPELLVPFSCDIHPWMSAWVGVEEHPWFAVTGLDGAFELRGVPPGTYTLEAIHESKEIGKKGKVRQEVTLAPSETVEVVLTFE